MRRNYLIAILLSVLMLGAAVVVAQLQIWPLRLRVPDGEGWWFMLLVFFPLLVLPLVVIPNRIATPLILALTGIGMIAATVCWQPDLWQLSEAVAGFVALVLIVDPRILPFARRLIARLRRPRNNNREEPPEFSPAMVPREPRKPSPLAAHARVMT
jgi:hypothetical protein